MAKKVPISVSLLDMDVVITTSIEGEDSDTKLKTVCTGGKPEGHPEYDPTKPPHAPVRTNQVMRCTECKKEASSHWGFPVKAHENEDGTFTPLTEEQMAAAQAGPDLTGRISLTMHPIAQVEEHTVPYGRFYYAVPGKTALSKYATVREGIRRKLEQGFVFCTMYAPSTAAGMYRIGVSGDLITLTELAKPEQVKVRPAVNVPDAREADVVMFCAMADTVLSDFDPAMFADQRKATIAAALASATPVVAGSAIVQVPVVTGQEGEFERAFRLMQEAGILAVEPEPAPAKPVRKRAPRKAAAKVTAA